MPCSSRKEAKELASQLINLKLAACANILGPINSIYKWDGKIQDDEEYVLILKSTELLAEQLSNKLEELHSYDCPCILALDSKANNVFSEWLNKELS